MNENNALMNETREGRPIRWWYLVAVAAILALALGACSPSQPEVATPAPTVAAAQPTPVFGPVQRLPAAPAQGLSSTAEVQRISPADAKKLMDEKKAVLYDVRSLQSYNEKRAVGALLLPTAEGEPILDKLPKDKILIFYCT
jgi:hypothetical protein